MTPGDRVAVFTHKTAATVAELYGIMRAGAAYVPVDPGSTARAEVITRDSGAKRGAQDAEVYLSRMLDADPGLGGNAGPSDIRRGPSDLAYILYTSGSTGAPKGVMLTHANALSFVEWAARELGLTADDRLSSHAPFHFDLSVFDLYASAAVGATVSLVPEEATRFGASTAEFVRDHAITVWYSVPSAIVQWVTQGGVEPSMLTSLRHVVFAGEVFPTRYLRKLRALVPHARLWNWYGPTETNACTYHIVTDEDLLTDDPIPIGRACDGYPMSVLDDGELVVGGPAVTPGYWNDPAKSAAALFTGPDGGRWYRTGDLVVAGPDGEYRFLGRRDHQVKVRGYRVELGEVEAAIYSHELVREACVVTVEDERLGHDIVAFVVGEIAPLEVRRHVASRLPRYMVPSRVELSDELPKTQTGKIDRQLLAKRAADG